MLPFLSASAKSNKALKIMRNDLNNSPTKTVITLNVLM